MVSPNSDVLYVMEQHVFVVFDVNPANEGSGGVPALHGLQGQLTEAEAVFA